MKLKAYTSYNEYRNQKFYRYFDIVDECPKVDDDFDGGTVKSIWEVSPDTENSDEVFMHNLYKVEVYHEDDEDGYTDTLYIAVPDEEYDEEE